MQGVPLLYGKPYWNNDFLLKNWRSEGFIWWGLQRRMDRWNNKAFVVEKCKKSVRLEEGGEIKGMKWKRSIKAIVYLCILEQDRIHLFINNLAPQCITSSYNKEYRACIEWSWIRDTITCRIKISLDLIVFFIEVYLICNVGAKLFIRQIYVCNYFPWLHIRGVCPFPFHQYNRNERFPQWRWNLSLTPSSHIDSLIRTQERWKEVQEYSDAKSQQVVSVRNESRVQPGILPAKR